MLRGYKPPCVLPLYPQHVESMRRVEVLFNSLRSHTAISLPWESCTSRLRHLQSRCPLSPSELFSFWKAESWPEDGEPFVRAWAWAPGSGPLRPAPSPAVVPRGGTGILVARLGTSLKSSGESNSEVQPVPALDHLWDADGGKEPGSRRI